MVGILGSQSGSYRGIFENGAIGCSGVVGRLGQWAPTLFLRVESEASFLIFSG